MQTRQEMKVIALCFAFLSVLSVMRQIWLHAGGMQFTPIRAVIIFFVYILLLNVWWASILRRVAQKHTRAFLAASHWLVVGWFVVRLLQNGITAGAVEYGRFSGYLLVIPVVFGFLLHFYASLLLGKSDDAKLGRRWFLLLIPAGAITVGFLTNDLHSFFHTEIPVESGPSNLYGVNVGFFLTGVWIVVMELAKIVNIFRSGRRIGNRFLRWLPVLEMAAMILYSVPYIATAFAPPEWEFIEFTAALFFYETMIWETCILIGVLPVNSEYREIFRSSDIGMQILYPDGNVFLRSGGADTLDGQQFAMLLQGKAAQTPDGRSLHLAPVSGGYAVWHTDTREIQRLTEELQEKKEALESEDILLRTELMNRRELQRVRERQRIYRMIHDRTKAEREAALAIIPRLRAAMERMGTDPAAADEARALLEEGCGYAMVIKDMGNRLLEGEYREETGHEA